MTLTYHTFYRQFEGNSAEDIVKALYQDSRAGLDATFEEWWQYQTSLWNRKYGLSVPDQGSENAAQGLLDVLLKVGALNEGEKPLKNSAAVPGPRHG